MGIRDQPWFLNLVIEGLTGLPPRALLRSLQQIEVRLGRIRHADAPRNGPRTVDIDILLYGSLMIQEEGIEIPHPRMERRRFVLEPLIEIAPDLRHPVSGVLFSEILSCAEPETTRKLQG